MYDNLAYNIIKKFRESKAIYLNLEVILDKMGNGASFSLADKPPCAVTIEPTPKFYIMPVVEDLVQEKDPKIIIFSAPGATGKSALARYISNAKHALLWDLSKEKIASHSFSGMLLESLGSKEISRFMEGLTTGQATLVVDALDEAELVSGRAAVEMLLSDLRNTVKDASMPNIVLCARTETAHFIQKFYQNTEHRLHISRYEISFFEETSAIEFTCQTMQSKGCLITPAIKQCITSSFNEIKRLLGNEPAVCKTFIGYAPVLEALAVFFSEESNTMQLIQKIENAKSSAEIFVKIINHILEREQKKVINGFKKRCISDYPDFKDWDSVYSLEEQLVRLINFVLFNEVDLDAFENHTLPHELQREYKESIREFIVEHPFIHHFERNNEPFIDFTGPAFRDFTLAKLMTNYDGGIDADDYAQCYFTDHKHNTRFPSQLYFDLYVFFSHNHAKICHFKYLYDAFKAKERTRSETFVSVEQDENDMFFIFRQSLSSDPDDENVVELDAEVDCQSLEITQLRNAYVDIDIDLLVGNLDEDSIIEDSQIRCKRLVVNSPNIMLVSNTKQDTVIACMKKIDSTHCPSAKFDIRMTNEGSIKISIPEIESWFMLRKYYYNLDDVSEIDVTKFENAMRNILKYFRKHNKDAAGKHKDYIENIVVGNSGFKRSVLDFLKSEEIIYNDNKDPRQYKLNNTALEELGIYWSLISQNTSRSMQKAYDSFCNWARQRDLIQR